MHMKIVSVCALVFLYQNTVLAMAEEESAAEENWRQQIYLLSQNYLLYLPSQYACVCTRFFHRTFSSKTALDESRKTLALKQLLIEVKDQEICAEEIADLVTEMAPFADQFGQSYEQSARMILRPLLSKTKECAICMERPPSEILNPCGHFAVCAICLDDMREHSSSLLCPICKTVIKKAVSRDSHFFHCRACKKAPVEILFVDCGHVSACENCANSDVCPVCNNASEERIKVFFN